MANLERRISTLEKHASVVQAPNFVVHFVYPVRGTVSVREMHTGRVIERFVDESEEQFLERCEMALQPAEALHGNQS